MIKKHKSIYLPIVMMLALLSSCNQQTVDVELEKQKAVQAYIAKIESEKQLKLDAIQKFYGVFATGDMSVLPEILAENYTQYPADPGQTPDIEGFIKHAQHFGSMFSELDGAPSHILVDGDLVFVRSELQVTHSGKAFEIPATNKRINMTAFDLHHFNEAGKIDKTWHLEDFWGAYSQISAQ